MSHITKSDIYDKFRCIGGQCSFSCCKGWEISVDSNTYSRWKKDEKYSEFLCSNVKQNKGKSNSEARMKMGTDKTCAFLNEHGLCSVIINCNEDYLSETCRTFPRLVNNFTERTEYSLSCACPVVVDMINDYDGTIKYLNDDEIAGEKLPASSMLKDTALALMQKSSFSLKDRILLIFSMLLTIKENEKRSDSVIKNYCEEQFLISSVKQLSVIIPSLEDTLQETNELLLDIIMNYRKEKHYKTYLQDIYKSAIAYDTDATLYLSHWNEFVNGLGDYDKLIENCITTKIFAGCNNDNIDEMIVSFQMVITEYIMIRYSVFLKGMERYYDKDKKTESNCLEEALRLKTSKRISYNDIRDNIVVYSRIIGYNQDGIREFWEESFDNSIWELGYMLMLLG